ncbi:hypothetical protein FG386_000892 [Cryptosporidium ryanae]|uniref:uncharacterized protein n=1 Tax=Cryptosporidium ryanae TaxID=515981 RepID=UPI00351A34C8|nr:hypothetical protein FG386_000892 [Cryptosporidium ryanae]
MNNRKNEFMKLILVGLLPSLNAIIWMHVFSKGWFAMYSMHVICMMIIPTFLYGPYFKSRMFSFFIEIKTNINLLKLACIGFLTSTVGLLTVAILKPLKNVQFFETIIGNIKSGLTLQGIIQLDRTKMSLFTIISFVYLCVVNPVIEELFWRFFIAKELIRENSEYERIVQSQEEQNSYCNLNDFIDLREIESGTIHKNIKNKEFRKIISSLLYSSYHFFVFSSIITNTLAILGAILLVFVGRFLLYVYEKYNITHSIYIHIGLDIIAVISLFLIFP